jgi:putative nucleotidyltransferase with HDIG domain
MITREQAWQKLNGLMSNQNLIKHCLAVEAAMLAYADYFRIENTEKEKWAVAGLLHDADYEKHPDQHPQIIIEWLKEQGADEDLLNAVAAHGFEFRVEPKALMAKTLRAVDELTGLVVAVALVRPSKKLSEVTVEAVLRKWKDKAFARGVKREDIERGAAEIQVPLEKHIKIVLTAMQGISDQLGL